MKRLFLFLTLSILFSSCFEIVEEISLNENGSGKFNFVLNMSQSKAEINSLRELDSVGSFRVPSRERVEARFNQGLNILRKSNGISNVKLSQNYEEYIFELSFDFKNDSSFNAAITNCVNQMSGKKYDPLSEIFWNGMEYRRDSDLQEAGLFRNLGLKADRALKTSNYTQIVRLSKTGKSVGPSPLRASKSRKAFMKKTPMEDVATMPGKFTLGHVIIVDKN